MIIFEGENRLHWFLADLKTCLAIIFISENIGDSQILQNQLCYKKKK